MEFRKGPSGQEITRTLNLRQAQQEFGLSDYLIYSAVHRGEIRAIQPGGKGRIYYLEDELRRLSERQSQLSASFLGAA